jgi:nicotinamide-nucleotide amidase
MKSAVISIGNEILLGKTTNSNLAFLAAKLAEIGIPVEFCLTVKDDSQAILESLQKAVAECDVVISTGGLGPTEDDITKATIARFFGCELEFDPSIWEHVQRLFAARNMPTPQINRSQAMVPRGFTALRNDRGTAPGLFYEHSGKCFFALAGVPLEMAHVFLQRIIPILRDRYPALKPVVQRTLHTFNISESALAEIIDQGRIPPAVSFAWLPQTGRVDLRLYGTDIGAISEAEKYLMSTIPRLIWGRDEDTPTSKLGELLLAKGLTLSTAESCTGGLVGKMCTDLAGASDYYLGSVVAYSNDLKESLLGVDKELIAKYGAVSEECALMMAQGIKRLTKSGTAISVTGVAGPSGGTMEKPVGTVCFGFAVLDENWTLRTVFTGTRETIRHKAAEFAILSLTKYLSGSSD